MEKQQLQNYLSFQQGLTIYQILSTQFMKRPTVTFWGSVYFQIFPLKEKNLWFHIFHLDHHLGGCLYIVRKASVLFIALWAVLQIYQNIPTNFLTLTTKSLIKSATSDTQLNQIIHSLFGILLTPMKGHQMNRISGQTEDKKQRFWSKWCISASFSMHISLIF